MCECVSVCTYKYGVPCMMDIMRAHIHTPCMHNTCGVFSGWLHAVVYVAGGGGGGGEGEGVPRVSFISEIYPRDRVTVT